MAGEPEFDLGTAGASARRQHERRRAKREEETRKRHPHIGGVLLKLGEEPQHEQAWATGAKGEEELGSLLDRRCPDALVLHDRRMPESRANVDHIAVAPSGVYVIDAKRYKGRIEVRKPFLGDANLFIRGRDRSKLVEGLARQVEAVRGVLKLIESEAPVRACFCFLNPDRQAGGSGLPVLRTLRIGEFDLLYPRRLAKRLNQPGPIDAAERLVLAEALAALLPTA